MPACDRDQAFEHRQRAGVVIEDARAVDDVEGLGLFGGLEGGDIRFERLVVLDPALAHPGAEAIPVSFAGVG